MQIGGQAAVNKYLEYQQNKPVSFRVNYFVHFDNFLNTFK